MNPAAVGPDESMGIGQRLIPEEPMAMVCPVFILFRPPQPLNVNVLWSSRSLISACLKASNL